MKKLYSLFVFAIAMSLTVRCSNTPSANVETWTIASKLADCTGVGPQKCMLVKHPGTDGSWHFFYSGIEGFDYVPGYEYIIKVSSEKVSNPPADASSIRYKLVDIVSMTEKESENLPEIVR